MIPEPVPGLLHVYHVGLVGLCLSTWPSLARVRTFLFTYCSKFTYICFNISSICTASSNKYSVHSLHNKFVNKDHATSFLHTHVVVFSIYKYRIFLLFRYNIMVTNPELAYIMVFMALFKIVFYIASTFIQKRNTT